MKVEYSYYKESITPANSLNLVGLPRRTNHKVTLGPNELFVKILWLRANTNLIFISMDSLYFSRYIADNITKYAINKYSVDQECLIFNASHSHSAPCQDIEFFGHIDESHLADIEDKILKGLDICYNNMKIGFIEFNHIECGENLFISRRKMGRDIKTLFIKKRIIRLPNKEKIVDNKIHIIRLYDDNGSLSVIVYNLSCHPVFNINGKISSDFVGYISNKLENRFCKQAIFLQGFSGDVRPNYTETRILKASCMDAIKLIFNEEVFIEYSEKHFHHFCNTVIECITKILMVNKSRINDDCLQCKIHTRMYTETLESRTGKTKNKLIIKIIRILNNIFISIPAEVLSNYIVILTRQFPCINLFPLGYANGMIGYLPSAEEISEGGYEVATSYKYYGWDNRISEHSIRRFTDRMIVEISALLREE